MMRHASISEALSSLDTFSRLWRRRRVFATAFLATIGITVFALLVLPVRYRATASVIVAEQEPGVANASPVWAQKIGDPADLESQLLVIRSPRIMRLVMNTPGVLPAVVKECERGLFLSSGESCQKLNSDNAAFIEYIQNHYSVASAGRSRVINISYQCAISEVAQRLANALTSAFLQDQRTEGANSREVATSWLWQELRQLDGQLREADEKIQKFRRTKGLVRGATASITSERLTSIGQRLSAAEAARADAAARLQEIKSEQARGPTDAPSVLSSRTIADLKQQLTAVSAQLAGAASILGPKHPSMLAVSREQALIQQRLADEMQHIAASAQKAYDANDSLVKSLKKQMEIVKAEAGSATLDEASIESMVRDTEIKRQQYAELYKKASELETERRVLLGSTRLVSLAELPDKPFFPKKIPFLAVGSTIALILGIAASLLADRLPPRLPTARTIAVADTPRQVAARVFHASAPEPEQRQARGVSAPHAEGRSLLETMTGVPVLARLPRLKGRQQVSSVAAILRHYVSVSIAEALRLAEEDDGFQQMLRNITIGLRIETTQPPRRILVTSLAAGDGKTVTTLAFAQHLAAAGFRVLVAECDWLNPAFESALSVAGGPGLLGVLAGSTRARDAVVRTAYPNLDALVAGRNAANNADLLASADLTDLLSNVGYYDVVLIDSSLSAIQARNVARMDQVLVCMKSTSSLIGRSMSVINAVNAGGARNVAIAVTMAGEDSSIARQPERSSADAYARVG
jgi:polysaccharide biosynthesis transport protein